MNNLTVFNNEEFGSVRIVEVDGKEMFVASDVARALGYARPNDAINQHCKCTVKYSIPHPQSKSKTMEANVIGEGDLYRLIVHSKLPSAEKFESWVFDEVLPSIRKHGAYMTDSVVDAIYNDPQVMIDLLTKLKQEKEARVEAERKNAILTHVSKLYTSTEIAKELGFKSAIALNKDLHSKKIQYQSNGTWVLYSQYSDMALTSIKQTVLDNGKVVYDRKWTQEGREFLLNLYNEEV